MKTTQPSPVPAETGLRERRKSATRRELILAGQRLFGEKGLYESRIEDLTSSAGIAKGTLYTYFADKDELVLAVASSGFARLEEHVSRRAGTARRENDLLQRVVRAHLEFFDENSDLMRVFHQLRGMLKFDREEWRPLRATMNGYLAGLARILARTPRIEALPAARRLEVARLVLGTVSGVTSVAMASGASGAGSRDADVLVRSLAAAAAEFLSGRARSAVRPRQPSARAASMRQRPRSDPGP